MLCLNSMWSFQIIMSRFMFCSCSPCDTTSYFFYIGKWTFLASAKKRGLYIKIDCAIQKLKAETLTEAKMFSFQDIARKLIISDYGRNLDEFSHCDWRVHLYPRKKELKALPPTEDAFVEHSKRSYYQLSTCNASLIARLYLSIPLSYGW